MDEIKPTEDNLHDPYVLQLVAAICKLEDELERKDKVVEAAQAFLKQHDSGDDATAELEALDELLAAHNRRME